MRAGHRLGVAAFGSVAFVLQHGGKLFVATEHVVDGGIRQRRGFLRHRGQPQLGRDIQLARIAVQLALQRGEQAGLAAAVAADHAQTPAALNDQINIGKQQAGAAAQGKVSKSNHGVAGVRIGQAVARSRL